MVGTLGSSQRVELLADVGYAAYVPPGLIVFWRDSRMMAQRFDVARLRLEGEALPVDPQQQPETVLRVFNWHARVPRRSWRGPVRRHGEITAGNARLAWLDRAGRVVEVLTPLGGYFNPRLSPDERTIAVEQFDNENAGDLWTIDLRRKLGTRLTFDARRDSDAVWAPGGDRLAWTRGGDVGGEVLVQRARGGGPRRAGAGGARRGGSVRRGLVARRPHRRRREAQPRPSALGAIEFLPVDGGEPIRWPASGAAEGMPRFSPDGRWVAYPSLGDWDP